MTWSVSSNATPVGGSCAAGTVSASNITSAGVFTVPAAFAASACTVQITATSVQTSPAAAKDNVLVTLSPQIAVTPIASSVTPPNLFGSQTTTLSATISNVLAPATSTLNWSFVGTPFGTLSATTGASVTYTAPPVVSATTTVTIQVASASDPTKVQTIAITDNLTGGPGYDSNINFVAELYCGFLDRGNAAITFLSPACSNALGAIDQSGLNYWVGLIPPSGTAQIQSRAQVALSFYNSAEFQTSGAQVVDAYIGALNRDPDYAGFTFWTNQLKQGVTQLTMLNTFITSPEFTAIYGNTTNTQFVTLVYQNVLGRSPDTAGLNYWVAQLGAGVSRASMLQAFVNGAEFQTLSNNRVLSIMAYMGFLRRTPDSQGRAFWTNQLNLGISAVQLITSFITSPEFIAEFPGPIYPN